MEFWFAELMLLGFISLLLTFGTKYIAKICIPVNVGDTMLPCNKALLKEDDSKDDRRRLLSFDENVVWRRGLAAASGDDYCSSKVRHISFFNRFFFSQNQITEKLLVKLIMKRFSNIH